MAISYNNIVVDIFLVMRCQVGDKHGDDRLWLPYSVLVGANEPEYNRQRSQTTGTAIGATDKRT
jgi:hypothetical protein